MLKKLKGVIIVAILFLASVMMPFNIFADDYTSSTIVGFNVRLLEGETTTQNDLSTGFVYEIEWVLDNYYVGYINLSFTVNTGTPYVSQARNYFINGNKFTTTFWVFESSGNNNTSERPSLSNVTYTVNSTNLSLIESEQYISEIPLESYPWIEQLYGYGYTPTNWNKYLNYYLPTFEVNQGNTLFYGWKFAQKTYYMCFYANGSIINSNINQYFTFSGFEVKQIRELNTFFLNQLYCIELYAPNAGTGTITANSSFKLLPLYFGYNTDILSLDFASLIGVNNKIMDNIQKIADGTTESSQVNNNLDSASSQFTDQSDDVVNVENTITNSFENQVNSIDINTGLSGFGGNFMTSATWVRTQFDRLTNSNPYGSLVTFGLTLGFALLMLGKVLL